MDLTQLSCEDFLSRLASKAPAPGGGGAAALVGAAGVALGAGVDAGSPGVALGAAEGCGVSVAAAEFSILIVQQPFSSCAHMRMNGSAPFTARQASSALFSMLPRAIIISAFAMRDSYGSAISVSILMPLSFSFSRRDAMNASTILFSHWPSVDEKVCRGIISAAYFAACSVSPLESSA